MRIIIKNGRIVDPAVKMDEISDLLVSDGRIEKIARSLSVKADQTIDAKGKIVAPAFVDMHAHFREPGREDKETVFTGSRAAVKGGFATVLCMPNTEPAIDNANAVKELGQIIARDALCNVLIAGAITEGRAGKRLTDFGALKKAGAAAVSDDGSSPDDIAVMREAIKKASAERLLLIDHCEDRKLSAGGVINTGFISTKTGLRGISKESEYSVVKRDIELAKESGGRIHIAHVSCKESVELVIKAKKEGVKVTAETAPHYFTLTEECAVTYDTNLKINPPLRGMEDVEAVKEGLSDGTIDVIATDHAPHTDAEKDVEFEFAPFGIIGLETALSLAVMGLVDTKVLSWPQLITKMSLEPSRILGIDKGTLKTGELADIVIIDPDAEYVYRRDLIESKSKNSPFIDWKLKARVTHLIAGGKLIARDSMIST